MDLRERHQEYWAPYSDTHPREHKSKCSTSSNHEWCALSTKRALVMHRRTFFPDTCFLSFLVMLATVECYPPRCDSTAHFRLSTHILRVETKTRTHNASSTQYKYKACNLCNAKDVQDEQHVLYHCTYLYVISLHRTNALRRASQLPPTGFHNVSFPGQNNNKLFFPSCTYCLL